MELIIGIIFLLVVGYLVFWPKDKAVVNDARAPQELKNPVVMSLNAIPPEAPAMVPEVTEPVAVQVAGLTVVEGAGVVDIPATTSAAKKAPAKKPAAAKKAPAKKAPAKSKKTTS
jgi:hypothetical protein